MTIIIINFFSEFSFFYIYFLLKDKRVPLVKTVILSTLLAFSSVYILWFRNLLTQILGGYPVLVGQVVNISVNTAAILLLERRNSKKVLFYSLLSYAYWYLIPYNVVVVISYAGILLGLYDSMIMPAVNVLIAAIPILIGIQLMRYLVSRFQVHRLSEYIFGKIDGYWKIGVLYIIFIYLTSVMEVSKTDYINARAVFVITGITLFAGAAITLRYIYAHLKLEDKEKMQETLLNQQDMYIQYLEDIQQNMRSLKHDYKNMISSLYLQSKEGDIRKVEESMQNVLKDFDLNIDRKMNMTNQLSRIKVIELKSLLMKKITDIGRSHIPFHAEVLYPVEKTGMEAMDLARVLGILFDNAIEEVKDRGGDINFTMLYEGGYLTIVLDNSLYHEIAIADAYRMGYSTKGKDRGIGLCIYQKIIDRYDNVMTQTSVQDGRFIQELSIEVDG